MEIINFELFKTLIISGISFLLALYIKNLYEKRQKKKFILVKLESYLIKWSNQVNTNTVVKKIFSLAIDFDNKIEESGSNENLENELKNELKRIKKEILNNDSFYIKFVESLFETYKKSSEQFQFDIRIIEKEIEYLMSGKEYLLDDESSYLPLDIARNVICLKTDLFELSKNKIEEKIIINSMQELDSRLLENNVEEIIYRLFIVARRYRRIRNYIYKIS